MTTHHPECEDATGAYPGSCTCAAIKRREALDNLIAQDADLIEICPDDLVRRLRVGDYYPDGDIGYHEISPGKVDALCEQAADRIEALTAALEKFDDLIQYQYTGSREAMSAMAEAAQEGARVLGRGAWKEAGQPWLWTYDAHLKEKQP